MMRLRNTLSALLLLLLPAVAMAAPDMAMQSSIKQFFAKGVYLKGAKAELIEVLRWPETSGALRWRMPDHKGHSDRVSLIAEQGENRSLKRWYVPVRLNWWANAVVLKKDQPARAKLTPDLLEVSRINVAGHVGSWWKKPADVTGMRLTRPLKAGNAVYASYVRRPKLIKRGDHVTMIVSQGGLKVTATGKALRSAGLGDRVAVKNLKSKKIVQGVVASASTVQIITGETL